MMARIRFSPTPTRAAISTTETPRLTRIDDQLLALELGQPRGARVH